MENIKDKQFDHRIVWLDISKVLGIYLMILGHQHLLDVKTSSLIFTFHMPLFFVISGLFWRSECTKIVLAKVSKSLFVPFIIISTFWCVFYSAAYIFNGKPLAQIVPYLLGTFISPAKDLWFMHPLCIYLWFFLALGFIKLIASLFKEKRLLMFVCVILFTIDILLSKFGIVLPLAIDSSFLALPFFCSGYLLKPFILKTRSVIYVCIFFIFSVLSVLVIGQNNGTVNIAKNLYGANCILFLLCGLSGAIMVFSLSKLMCRVPIFDNKFIRTLSLGTILVVGYSAMLTSIFRNIIIKCVPSINSDSNIFGIILGLVVLVSFYPLINICLRYFPAILGYRKK